MCLNKWQSISGFCFSLSSGLISWSAKQQGLVTLSTCEAESMAACEAAHELVWLCILLAAINFHQHVVSPLLCNNNGTVVFSEDPSFHSQMKHMPTQYYYLREHAADGVLQLHCVTSKDNVADAFTKALPRPAFEALRNTMGLTC